MKKQLLFVDDEKAVLDGLRRLLRDQREIWEMTFAGSVNEALQKTLAGDFDAIVSDIAMPGGDGFKLLQALRGFDRTKDTPIVMLTGMDDKGLKRRALELGATDLLCKPVDREELLARLTSCLRLKSYVDDIKTYNVRLEKTVKERTKELHDTRLQIIRRLGRAGEYRDNETGMHVIRMSHYAVRLGRRAGMSEGELEVLLNASPMHDIGKIGIPDNILLKPGKLNSKEWEIMKTHAAIGAEILSGDESDLLTMARTIALQHHEKWDGSGYPMGLKGEEISLEGRIVALCDVFEALRSERPYKHAWTVAESMKYIREQKGKHFDPCLVDYFEQILPEFIHINEQFPDEELMEEVKV